MLKQTPICNFRQASPLQLTRPWKTYRDGTLFYGLSKSGNNRTPLTTKQGNKNMYKGTRSSGIGSHNKRGGYTIDWTKVNTFVVPKFINFDLKPLVSNNVVELKHQFHGYSKGPQDPKLYFDKLKEFVDNGKIESEASDLDCYVERG